MVKEHPFYFRGDEHFRLSDELNKGFIDNEEEEKSSPIEK